MENRNVTENQRPKPSYFIVDGSKRACNRVKKIKAWEGYYNREAKCWQIDDPNALCRNALERAGLVLQFAKNK